MYLLIAKVYRRTEHRQKESFNEYSEIFIIKNSAKECINALYGQESGGIFENYIVSKIEIIKLSEGLKMKNFYYGLEV